jgi:hypothetical protein
MGSYDHLLDPGALENLASRSLDDVRSQRATCLEVETGLSYLRRLVQGSIDIIGRELGRRAGTVAAADLEGLVDELPDILGDSPRPPGSGRLSSTLEPTYFDDELTAEYDTLVGDGRLARVEQLDDDELDGLTTGLRALETRISEQRRAFHDHIDVLQAEITRRYQTGEASVDTVLRDA